MKNKIKNFVGHYIMLPIFGLERSIRIYYYIKTGKKINIENPTYYCEKLQIRKMNPKPIYSQCADKHLVREYVKEKLKKANIKDDIIIPEYFAKKSITLQDLKNLPEKFVIKTNNGCKSQVIVYDKKKANLEKIVRKMNNDVKIKFGYNSFEMFYNDIDPLIIAEELIGDGKSVPDDYKIFCFNQGNDEFIIRVQVDHGRFTDMHSRAYLNEKWEIQPYGNDGKVQATYFEKPKNLNKMIKIAKVLASDFDFVRVDLYSVQSKIYFGELTFTDGSGYELIKPEEYDREWATYWKQEK